MNVLEKIYTKGPCVTLQDLRVPTSFYEKFNFCLY